MAFDTTAPSSPLPTPGGTAGPAWAAMLNTAIGELQAIVTPRITGQQINLGTDSDLKHGIRTVRLGAAYGKVTSGAPTIAAQGEYYQATGAADEVMFALPMAVNDRLMEVSIYGYSAAGTGFRLGIWNLDPVASSNLTISTVDSIGTGRLKITIGPLNYDWVEPYYLTIQWRSGATGNRVYAAEYKYDKVLTP